MSDKLSLLVEVRVEEALDHIAARDDIPLALDIESYKITASKLRSNRLFGELKLPIPAIWPACEFPLIVKPDEDSGSKGVQIFHSPAELSDFFQSMGAINNWVAQEFVPGPTFSLEIIGSPGNYLMPQVTDLYMDQDYDCKGVGAPSVLSSRHVAQFEGLALRIAENLGLKGIMDVEVVLGSQGLKILEIDARLPSQTPTAVYWSTGINMLELLKDVFLEKPLMQPVVTKAPIPVLYEHIKVDSNVLEVAGEHIMGTAGSLNIRTQFFGADEALTDYQPGCEKWVATLIYTANDPRDVWNKRTRVLETLRNKFGCDRFIDSEPNAASI